MTCFFHSLHLKATTSSSSSLPAPQPLSCCHLCHSPRCKFTLLAPPASALWCLCLVSAGASSLCCRLSLLSTGAFNSASCHASASRQTSASCRAPLVWLVVAFPSASASTSRRAFAWRLGFHHLLRLHHLSCPFCLVSCRIAQRLNPHLVTTPPSALASTSHCTFARDSSWCHLPPLPPPYLSHTTSPSPAREQGLPKHCCFCCRCDARLSPVWSLLC